MTAAKPIFSIMMPMYDTPAKFLTEAVESVLRQTDPRWELLLVNDGSGQTSTLAAKKLARLDPQRIRYYEHEGRGTGPGPPRNLGIEQANGHYVAFLDADDVWEPTKIEQQLALLDAHPQAGAIYGNTEYWHSWSGADADRERDYIPPQRQQSDMVYEPPSLLLRLLEGTMPLPCMCSIVVNRNVVETIGGFLDTIPSIYEDQVFVAKVCLETAVYVSSQCWDRYRQWDDSTCPKAERAGETPTARRAYLDWLSEYAAAHPAASRKLIWEVNHQVSLAKPNFLNPGKVRQGVRRIRRKLATPRK